MAGVGLGTVALLAEGVDRNRKPARPLYGLTPSPSSRRAWIEIFLVYNRPDVGLVALLAEGVDRNIHPAGIGRAGKRSPSSRRAWIEM